MQPHLQKRWHAPLFDTLSALRASGPVSYHVPGHKYGASLPDANELPIEAARAMKALRGVMELDVTELTPTDDLHAPSGVIEEAQRLAAATFGAERTYFIVGGSTAGNLAMLLAVCGPEELVLVQRNAHKSVLNGLRLAGARAVFLMPETDEGTELHLTPSLEQVELALQRYPESKAVFLTNPSYYGLSASLQPYADLIHRHGKMLLVDEAHGAHYGLHPAFPSSALQDGADAVVQSTHKTLTALTMGAMLHVQGDRIDRDAVLEALRMIQSSSPSYPIMASLDITRAMIDVHRNGMFDRGLAAAEAVRAWIGMQRRYELAAPRRDTVRVDPLRMSIFDRTGALTGFELQRRLEAYGCYAEMADSRYVVLLFGIGASLSDVERLQQALSEIAVETEQEGLMPRFQSSSRMFPNKWHTIAEPVTFARAGKSSRGSDTERIALDDAKGRISSEAVIPYPPGIPLIYEGERITAETVAVVKQLVADGARCQGAEDPTMRTIAVVAER
ncbi:Arginine/lysine/ornithine decarboxylase [Paenibacillus sp. UNC496MF]|uniref:aminotransferase class I/II-fold pyridoxal phosphate-dependent enzyme n=1 Tax=Paenibacillus sp. UNC496MF TaxID=1502753 RepID=UPI0008DF54EC|nr:Arginine/lysine/ornithine decarboxylase [Paenibacillus sp. UNC496MF]